MSFRDETRQHRGPAPERLDRALRRLYPNASWSSIRRLVTSGKVSVSGRVVLDPATSVSAAETIGIRMSAPRPSREPELPDGAIVFVDAHVVVVDKPAGVSTVPFREGERGALSDLVAQRLARRERRRQAPLGIVHRIDKETSGLLVFARTLAAQRALKQQFRFHTVHRRYLAIVHGRPKAATLSSRLVRDRGDGLRGSTDNPKLGRPATTHVVPRRNLGPATLVECALETGRTHQIRIQLSEAGHPLVGERVYVRDYRGELLPAPRVMLHAAELGFDHPATGRPLRFVAEPPPDFRELVASLACAAG